MKERKVLLIVGCSRREKKKRFFSRIRETTTIRLSHVSVLLFFFFPLSFPTFSSPPPSHLSPRFLSPRPRHPSVVSSLLPLLDTVDPWWHRRGRATVTRYFAGEIPPENPLWKKFFSLGPNSGRLHCRIIATPLNRNPSAEEEVIVPRAPPTNQPVATFFSSPPRLFHLSRGESSSCENDSTTDAYEGRERDGEVEFNRYHEFSLVSRTTWNTGWLGVIRGNNCVNGGRNKRGRCYLLVNETLDPISISTISISIIVV